MNTRPIVLLFLVLCVSIASAQKKYEKRINKSKAQYEKGEYEKAFKTINKMHKKAAKKFGLQNQYTPTYYVLLAKYNLASGFLSDFESNLQMALGTSLSINKDSSTQHGLMFLNAAELNIENGAYRVAKEYLEQANKVLTSGNHLNDAIKARLDMTRAKALSGQGFYVESLEILKEREPYFAGRAVKQESYVDTKGALKSRKLSEDEVKERFHDYASLLTLTAHTYGKQGNLRSADSLFVYAASWIKKNLSTHSMEYIENQFFNANILIENGNENLPKDLEYSRTLNSLKRDHKPSHKLGVLIYEEYIKQLFREESNSRYKNTKQEYEKMINKAYAKNSIYKIRLKAVEFDSKLNRDKTKNLENDANEVLKSAGLPKNNITTTEILDFLYTLTLQQKKYTNAEKYLNDIVEIKSNLFGSHAPETQLARIHLANFYVDYTNKITEAAKIYQESFTNSVEKEIGTWHKDHLVILNHLATLYELTDKFKEAEATLDKASDVARSKYDDRDYQYGVELNHIARLQIKLGQYEKAEADVNKSLTILEEFRKEETKKVYLINAIETKAVLLGIKGLFDEAEDALDRATRMIKKSDNLVGIDELSTAKELSSLFIQLGRYSETERILDELIEEYEKLYGNNSLRLIEPLVNKGRLILAKGDYTEAEKIARRALQIATQVYTDQSTKAAPAQKLLGSIYYTIGDYDKAQDNVSKALQSQRREFGPEHIEVAKSLSQLALIKFYKGDNHKEVEPLLIEARDIIGKRVGKDNPQYAEVLKDVAVLYIHDKRYDVAFNSLTQAEAIWRAKTGSKRNINAAGIYTLTGDVYYQLKNYNKAEDFYNKGKDIYESNFSRNHPEYVKVLSKLSKVYFMKKEFKAAKRNIEEALSNYENFIKQFFPALSEREKAKYWNTIKGDFEFYNTLAFGNLDDFRDLTGKVYNYQLLTKALLLSSSIKIRQRILNSQDENLKTSYNLWVQKKEMLTNALSMSTQQLTENEINTTALSNEVEALEKQLSLQSELFGQSFENKRITYENVQKSIGKNDVAVEMVRYRYFNHSFTDSIVYVALYVKNDNARPKAIPLGDGNKMETRYFRYYRNCITSKITDNYSYKVFWEPIQKEIGQYATIYISPDGVYNQLNLEAIPTPDGKYIIDNSNIVIISNTKDLYLQKLKSKQTAPANNATVFGNPTFYLTASADNNIPSLPGTEKEVAELQDLLKQKGWKTNEYTATSATEERIKELDSPKIFHIATHGFYTPTADNKEISELAENEAELGDNPLLKTGLLLKGAGDVLAKTKYNYNIENGILTAYEAMNLNLDKTDLVVLSACETGLGEISNGEGVYGLQRAFLVAGAKTLIMSMFKVDDEATQKLILNFYRKWLATNNLRQSFVDAKKELRNEYPEPIYWGAFMMIGLDQ
jgi:CHAT domain-containing protein/tetratricopeptide (TPR) repeat protein